MICINNAPICDSASDNCLTNNKINSAPFEIHNVQSKSNYIHLNQSNQIIFYQVKFKERSQSNSKMQHNMEIRIEKSAAHFCFFFVIFFSAVLVCLLALANFVEFNKCKTLAHATNETKTKKHTHIQNQYKIQGQTSNRHANSKTLLLSLSCSSPTYAGKVATMMTLIDFCIVCVVFPSLSSL